MFRTILLPTTVAALIAVPMLYQKSNSVNLMPDPQNAFATQEDDYNYYVNPQRPAVSTTRNQQRPSIDRFSPPPPASVGANQFRDTGNTQPVYSGGAPNGYLDPNVNLDRNGNNSASLAAFPVSTQPLSVGAGHDGSPVAGPAVSGSNTAFAPNTAFALPADGQFSGPSAVDFNQLTPDYGKIETRTYRGNALGPDLNSQPLQFIPVANFQEIFRFDVSPTWVKQRWQRLTAIPAQGGLHGLRTALVTGTNSWDLNGSLTYFFDQHHRIQRIAFRGWVGDPARLINLATQHFGFTPQPTHWAGLYLATFGGSQTGMLLMKDPDTIDSRNPVQQTAVILEINQPAGGFQLSPEAIGFLQPALPKN